VGETKEKLRELNISHLEKTANLTPNLSLPFFYTVQKARGDLSFDPAKDPRAISYPIITAETVIRGSGNALFC
jgi:hypothetical protein